MIHPALLSEIFFEFTRSRGPGGQHVNKTNSAAVFHWHLTSSKYFSEEQKNFLKVKLQNFLNKDGFVNFRSDQFREQSQNRQACLGRFENLLKEAFYRPKKRFKTKPSRSSIKKRVDTKKKAGENKKLRRKIDY